MARDGRDIHLLAGHRSCRFVDVKEQARGWGQIRLTIMGITQFLCSQIAAELTESASYVVRDGTLGRFEVGVDRLRLLKIRPAGGDLEPDDAALDLGRPDLCRPASRDGSTEDGASSPPAGRAARSAALDPLEGISATAHVSGSGGGLASRV